MWRDICLSLVLSFPPRRPASPPLFLVPVAPIVYAFGWEYFSYYTDAIAGSSIAFMSTRLASVEMFCSVESSICWRCQIFPAVIRIWKAGARPTVLSSCQLHIVSFFLSNYPFLLAISYLRCGLRKRGHPPISYISSFSCSSTLIYVSINESCSCGGTDMS